jgi:hypothetical protein
MTDADLDRLADFLAGALDGTPAEAEVRQRLAAEPTFAAAMERLVAASASVSDDLRAFAGNPEPMPADVADRIEAALGAAGAGGRVGPDNHTDRASSDRASSDRARPDQARPDQARPDQTRPDQARHGGTGPGRPDGPGRRTRGQRLGRGRGRAIAMSAAAVAVLVLVAGVLVPQLSHTATSKSTAGSAANRQGSSSIFKSEGQAPRLVSSGNDYTRQTVGTILDSLSAAPAVAGDGYSQGSLPMGPRVVSGSGAGAAELSRLADRSALATCLGAVLGRHGGVVTLVDYARFDGQPALVVLLQNVQEAPGGQFVVVVGPACGQSGGTDERFAGAI